MKKLYLLLITVIYVLLMFIYWQAVSADESYVEGQRAMKRGEFELALEQADKSINKNPREPRYYYGKAKILLAATVNQDEETAQEFKLTAASNLLKARGLNKRNMVTNRNIVPLYYFLGVKDLKQSGGSENIDEKYIDFIKGYYQSIKHYSVNDVGVYALLAKYEKKLGLEEGYLESVDSIRRLRPDLLEWYLIQ